VSQALGKDFTECNTRQKILSKDFIGKGFLPSTDFAEYRKTLGKLRIKKTKNRKTFFKLWG
jgi:hypothetical protein